MFSMFSIRTMPWKHFTYPLSVTAFVRFVSSRRLWSWLGALSHMVARTKPRQGRLSLPSFHWALSTLSLALLTLTLASLGTVDLESRSIDLEFH